MTAADPADASTTAPADSTAEEPRPARPRRPRLGALRQLVPTPRATPFTLCYGLVLLATAVYAEFGDEATVNQLLRDSSTDAAHLADRPLVVLFASALWVAGGLWSFFGWAFAPVLGALERRVGGLRTAGVFLLGHVLATLATELPVAGAVAAGRLPAGSLHRLDYGISFGLMACLGALASLQSPPWKWGLLGAASLMCAQDLIELADPLASWGHPIALLAGVACRVLLRGDVRGGARADVPVPVVAPDASGSVVTPGASGSVVAPDAPGPADGAVPLPAGAVALPGPRDPSGAQQQGPAGRGGGVPGRDVGEQPVEGGAGEPVRRGPAESEPGGDVMGVDDGLHHAHGREPGPVGVAPRMPGPVVRSGGADGGGEERRRDADALQPR
ncbi:rhomboid-like protein [Streptomyces sp. I05A-00742]|uniref:rhomboid-like protein n=1 Tax=Streptomyces sp. I05A-00742 TaxID=2732853 RepID=UPI0037D9E9D2